MNAYKTELAKRVKLEQSLTIEKLPSKKRGHPYLLGEEMDRQLQEYIKSLREAKAVINSAIVISAAEGIVKGTNSSLLEVNGGYIKCTKHWAKHFYIELGMLKEGPLQRHQYQMLILRHKRLNFYLISKAYVRWKMS